MSENNETKGGDEVEGEVIYLHDFPSEENIEKIRQMPGVEEVTEASPASMIRLIISLYASAEVEELATDIAQLIGPTITILVEGKGLWFKDGFWDEEKNQK